MARMGRPVPELPVVMVDGCGVTAEMVGRGPLVSMAARVGLVGRRPFSAVAVTAGLGGNATGAGGTGGAGGAGGGEWDVRRR